MRKVDIIVDLQYGSTGKGLLAGKLAKEGKYDTVVNANMPNAGHTFIDKDGVEYMHKVLPNGAVGGSVRNIMIGPGSVFSADRLKVEIEWLNENNQLNGKQIYIHQGAMVLDQYDAINELNLIDNIGSTAQGSAEAMIRKIRRTGPTIGPLLQLAEEWGQVTILDPFQWQLMIHGASDILVEGAQGFSLGINQKFYPFTTSRDCTPARFMADCAIPVNYHRYTFGTARMHPIRVGGNSGSCYSDQQETDWAALGLEPETTTVTGRVRRVFTYSLDQIAEAVIECQPDSVFLNFCNYDPDLVMDTIRQTNVMLRAWVGNSSRVMWTGWGAKETDVREVATEDVGDVTN